MAGTRRGRVVLLMIRLPYGLLAIVLMSGCSSRQDYGDFVARVGDATLTREQLTLILDKRTYALDSTEAASQIIEQWTTNELLFQEALQRGLRNDPEVIRLLSENERSVLISALVNDLYEEDEESVSEGAIHTYYEQHRDQLVLREPYIHVWYITVPESEDTSTLTDSLREAATQDDFFRLVDAFALEPDVSMTMSDSYYPLAQLFSQVPGMQHQLAGLEPGAMAQPVTHNGVHHLVRLVDRVNAGALPELEMIRPDIMRRVQIESRKQLFARQVQRLRTQALAREALEIR